MWIRYCAAVVALIVASGFVFSAHAAESSQGQSIGDAVAAVPRMSEPPKVDGKISKTEWRHAVQTAMFMGWRNANFEPRLGSARAGYTKERLYVAVVSEIPPTGLKTTKRFRDAKLIADSGIELWIDPKRDRRDTGASGDLRYYQNMFNAAGAVLDVAFDPAGSPDKGWNGDWNVANSVDEKAGTWTFEASIPWSSLNITADPAGKTIGLLISRNFKKNWAQAPWMPIKQGFSSVGSYPLVKLTKDSPVVQVHSLGGEDAFKGRVHLKSRIVNPGKARKVKARLHISSTDMPTIEQTKTLDLPAGGSATFAYEVPRGRLHARAKHTLTYSVRDAETGEVYYRRAGGKLSEQKGTKWNVVTGPQPQKAGRVAYYPSLGKLKVMAAPHFLGKDAPDVSRATIHVTGPDGNTLLKNKTLEWAKNKKAGHGVFQLLDKAPHSEKRLPEGEYTVSIKLPGRDAPMKRTFVRKHFPWENNELGITDKVYDPFEPVEVSGDTVSVVQRQYEKSGLGLWQSVQALDTELLASPSRLVVNGEDALEGNGSFKRRDKQEAVYEGSAKHPAVSVDTRTKTMYDGAMRVEMTLKPGEEQKELESMNLDIPIKDELAPLFHVSTTALRVNPAGKTPKGTGKIWDTTDFPDGEWYGGFRPYIWVGGAKRGLAWFADNDKGWVLDVDPKTGDYDPAFSLHRKDGVLTLRVHFVQKPITLKEKRDIVFGLMASPGKPMPENWRQYGRPDKPGITFSMGHVMGMPATFAGKYPLNGDFSPFDQAFKALKGESIDIGGFLSDWADRHLSDSPDKVRKRFTSLLRHGLRRAQRLGREGKTQDRLSVYFEEFHTTSLFHEEVPTFYSEWSGSWNRKGYPQKHKHNWHWKAGLGTGNIVKSYRDFAAYYGAKWLRHGMGLYFDNSFPQRASDTLTTSAYRLPDGTIQPSAGMWARRKYLRRIWVLHKQLYTPETPQMQMIHMTNSHIVPYMVFNQSNLDLEWMYGPEPAQSKYAADFLRAESIGRQSGNIPIAIADTKGSKASKAQKEKAERTRSAALLVHGIKPGITTQPYPKPLTASGYGLESAEVTNYWERHAPVSVSDERCKWLLVEHEGDATLLLVSWNPNPQKVTLTLGKELTKGGTPAQAVDPERHKTFAVTGNKLTVPMDAYGVRFLKLNGLGE